jgi:hypothetical protein
MWPEFQTLLMSITELQYFIRIRIYVFEAKKTAPKRGCEVLLQAGPRPEDPMRFLAAAFAFATGAHT